MNYEYNLKFDILCDYIGLSGLAETPEQIFGGLLHRMYAVHTTSGKYAIKALNPQVMLRPEAKPNIINAERIAQIASQYVPAAPAMVFDCGLLPEIDGQYYLVYEWIDGKTLAPNEISDKLCNKMGSILADIHKIDFSALNLTDNYCSDEKMVDWGGYLQKGKAIHALWLDLLSQNIDNLYTWNNRLIDASKRLALGTVISHRDLDTKNVMWCGDDPIIIDWEAAGFIHPMHDLVETARYWAADEAGKPQKSKFAAFVAGYQNKAGVLKADWPTVLDKGLGSMLGWLEYSLKRSLGIECADEEERRMGTEHVSGTLHMLDDYDRMKDRIIEWLEESASGMGGVVNA